MSELIAINVFVNTSILTNRFGYSASDLGDGLGEHSHDGGAAGDHSLTETAILDERVNVGGEGSETHPRDLAEALVGDCG